MNYWILAALSCIGTILNIKKNSWCFLIWGITNMSWSITAVIAAQNDPRMYAQAAMFFFYFILACYGWWSWRRPIKIKPRIKTLEE